MEFKNINAVDEAIHKMALDRFRTAFEEAQYAINNNSILSRMTLRFGDKDIKLVHAISDWENPKNNFKDVKAELIEIFCRQIADDVLKKISELERNHILKEVY